MSEWSRSMLVLARGFVSTGASAEEVVQDCWLAVVKGLDSFEGRSALRTWVYSILVNLAKTRGVQEQRSLPWSSLAGEDAGPCLDPALFHSGEPGSGSWRSAPAPWPEGVGVEDSALAGEVRRELRAALDTLPERQRIVVTLRDVLGHTAQEVCGILDISRANQRVLLHRGRTAARLAIATYIREG